MNTEQSEQNLAYRFAFLFFILMMLYAKCDTCEVETSFFSFSSDRGELQKTKGDKIEITCKNCKSISSKSVDDIYAKPSFLALISAILILVIGIVIILIFFQQIFSNYSVIVFTGLFLVPVVLFGMITKQDKERVSRFNRYKTTD